MSVTPLASTMQDIYKEADLNVTREHDELLAAVEVLDATTATPSYEDCIRLAGILAVLASRLAPCPTCKQPLPKS